jgi:GNAT superfamily N-acetyltransferase
MRNLTVTLLDGADPLADELATRHALEWEHLYEDWGLATARAEFREHKVDGSMPATLVLYDNGQVAGSVSLIYGDCEARRDLDPWLASLYIFPEFRGRGHAHRLVEAAIRHAAGAAQEELHVSRNRPVTSSGSTALTCWSELPWGVQPSRLCAASWTEPQRCIRHRPANQPSENFCERMSSLFSEALTATDRKSTFSASPLHRG